MQATMSPNAVTGVSTGSIWLRHALYDLCFFVFPWIPFLLCIVYGLPWQGDFSLAKNPATFKLITAFLFALNFAHRNYTYFVTYGDKHVFLTRKKLFTIFPLVGFTTVLCVYYFRHPAFVQILVSLLAVWNLWHNIMQRHGLFRGYANRVKQGLEARWHARLDLYLLWAAVLFAIAVDAMIHLATAKSYKIARPLVNLLAPFFETYPVPIAVVFGGVFLGLFIGWIHAEWRHPIPWRQRLPRLCYLASNLGILVLCILNPVLGILCFAFSHSVEYLAYVHAVQQKKIQHAQYQGTWNERLWNHLFGSALLLIGLQVLLYYNIFSYISRQDILLKTFFTGTAAIHFFYDGIIWKSSKKANKWVL